MILPCNWVSDRGYQALLEKSRFNHSRGCHNQGCVTCFFWADGNELLMGLIRIWSDYYDTVLTDETLPAGTDGHCLHMPFFLELTCHVLSASSKKSETLFSAAENGSVGTAIAPDRDNRGSALQRLFLPTGRSWLEFHFEYFR